MNITKTTPKKLGKNDIHRCDVFGVIYHNKGWVQRGIVDYQRKALIPEPYCQISHVGLVTIGSEVRGIEMVPPHGRFVDILDTYKDCDILFFRHHFGSPDERLKVLLDAAYKANTAYSYLGVASFLMGWIRPVTKHKFCSQLVADAFRQYGVELVPNMKPQQICPGLLCMSDALAPIISIDNS